MLQIQTIYHSKYSINLQTDMPLLLLSLYLEYPFPQSIWGKDYTNSWKPNTNVTNSLKSPLKTPFRMSPSLCSLSTAVSIFFYYYNTSHCHFVDRSFLQNCFIVSLPYQSIMWRRYKFLGNIFRKNISNWIMCCIMRTLSKCHGFIIICILKDN